MFSSATLLLVGGLAGPVRLRAARLLDLKGAVALALENNLSVQNAYLGRITDRYSYRVVYDSFTPQWSLTGYANGNSYYVASRDGRSIDYTAGTGLAVTLKNRIGGSIGLSTTQDTGSGLDFCSGPVTMP